ncbi:MAG: hypothetical protein ABI647_20205 [Gemmatimonadota bacterium]
MSEPKAAANLGRTTFSIDDVEHAAGDPDCSACYSDEYPQPCKCGGLIHDQFVGEGEFTILTDKRCDRCGEAYGNVDDADIPQPAPNADPPDAPLAGL